MRKGYNNSWLLDDNNNFFGINLGSDYCAEHEWGIEKLKVKLGVKSYEKVFGIENRRIKNPQENSIYLVQLRKGFCLFIGDNYYSSIEDFYKGLCNNKELCFYSYEQDLATAWSDYDLGILVKGKEGHNRLETLYQAIITDNAAIWFGSGQVFQNTCLCVGIIDLIPKDGIKEMYIYDEDRYNLLQESKKIGIKEKIDNINQEWRNNHKGDCQIPPYNYFSLIPYWNNNESNSNYKVKYWLNPCDQDKYNSMWCTVEALELWLQDKGPIVRKGL